MPSYAKITLVGHVGRDPKKPSESYPNFITFSVAVTTKTKDKYGVVSEKVDWYSCSTSREGLHKVVNDYVKKGDAVMITGRPKFDVYTAKDGVTKPKIEVSIDELVMLSSKKESSGLDTTHSSSLNNQDIPF